MKAEERYVHDYALVCALILLLKAQEEGQHGLFAGYLQNCWRTVCAQLPANAQRSFSASVLDAYFSTRGNVRQALSIAEEHLAQRVGYETHRAAMDRLRANAAPVHGLIKQLFPEAR